MNWIAATITAIFISILIALFLSNRCKEIIYLFTCLGSLVTMVCFMNISTVIKVIVIMSYIVFLFTILFFDSFKTPEDSLLKKDRPDVVPMKYNTGYDEDDCLGV